MTTLIVHPAVAPLRGSIPVPGDDRIGQLGLLLGALAEGESRIDGAALGPHTAAMTQSLRALGVPIDDSTPHSLRVRGVGRAGLRPSAVPLACGESLDTLDVLAGVLSSRGFRTTLVLDRPPASPALHLVVCALRARGAVVDAVARGAERAAALAVGPLPEGRELASLETESDVPDAALKGAVLFSGLMASQVTRFREPTVSVDHAERLLSSAGAPIRTVGPVVEIDPLGWNGRLAPLDGRVPGDVSLAALWVVAAQLVPGSRITARDVGLNPTRVGLLEIARDMGAGVAAEPQGERLGEGFGVVHAWTQPARAIAVGGETLVRAAADIPLIGALAARSAGTTRLRDAWGVAAERLIAAARMLRAFGVTCAELSDGLDVKGREGPVLAADFDARGDATVAMAAAVLALAAPGPSRIGGVDGLALAYPKFVATLRALGATVDVLP